MIVPDTLFDRFKAKFEALKGHVHLVASWQEAVEKAGAISREAKAQRVAVARAPAPFQEALERWCQANHTDLLRPPFAADTLPEAIDKAEVGITGMDFAIARTGTLVEVALDDPTRLVSSLPRTHIGLVSARELIDDRDAAPPRLRRPRFLGCGGRARRVAEVIGAAKPPAVGHERDGSNRRLVRRVD